MPKYSKEFKLKCIEFYEKNQKYPKIDGVSKKSVEKYIWEWKHLFKIMGEKGLDNTIFYKSYTLKDKIKACKRINAGENYTQVAQSIGMRTHSTVRSWYLAYLKDGIAGLQYRKGIKTKTSVEVSKTMKKTLTDSEREELISLRKRVEILEAENEFLKKLKALVLKEKGKNTKAK